MNDMTDPLRVVITGISGDLGGILAREFARQPGARVIGTMRRPRAASPFPSNVQVLTGCDLTQPAGCRHLAAAAADFEGPFGFIHCVGNFWDHVPFLDFGPEAAAEMFASHVTTLYTSLQYLIPVMRERNGSSCVAFSCNSVRYNYPWMASFTAAKSAVDSLIKSLANEFSGDGLRFNSLMLASVKTPKVIDSKPHGDVDNFLPPEDIIPVIRFLLSPESQLVNGNSINLFRHSEQYYHRGYFERNAK